MNKGSYSIVVRLSHLPTVSSNGVKFALWTDVKELLLLCADTYCSVVLEALNQIRLNTFTHACTVEEQTSFSRQFKIVELGTCLVNVELLQNPGILTFLFEYVRKEHTESCSIEALRCVQSLNNISQKYANTSFKIPLKMASQMRLLPALKRSFITHEQERCTDDNVSVIKGITQPRRNVTTLTLVPMCLLSEMFPECKRYLNSALNQYCQGLHGDGASTKIYKCSIEEGIQLTRFISTYKGYDSSWSCYTSNSLLMSWTEFWNQQDYRTQNILSCRLSNIGMIIINCQDFPSVVEHGGRSNKYPFHSVVSTNTKMKTFEGITNQNVHTIINNAQQIRNGSTVLSQDALFMPVVEKCSVNGIEKDLDTVETQYRLPNIDGHLEHIRPETSREESSTTENYRLINEGLKDEHFIDINNSASKKGIDISSSKPGCGDTRESDFNYKRGKELLSMNNFILTNSLNCKNGLSKSVDSTPCLVQAEKGLNYQYNHIIVPVCDNDSKVDYTNTENSSYDHSNTVNDETQGIHVSITPKSPSFASVATSNGNITRRKEDYERKFLKLSTAFINDDMPVTLRVDGKIPISYSTKYGLVNEECEDDRLNEVNDSVHNARVDTSNSGTSNTCEKVDFHDKPQYKSVKPIQLELTAPMLQGMDIYPNVIQEGRKLPYKPLRNDNKNTQERNIILFPHLQQKVVPCTPVPVVEGTQISFKSSKPLQQKNYIVDTSMSFLSHSDPAPSVLSSLNQSAGNKDDTNVTKPVTISHNNAEYQNDNKTSPSDEFVATGKLIKTFEKNTDFNSSEFMKERITMWRDSVERELQSNKTERQTKSAGVRRTRQAVQFRPSSSLYYSPGKFDKEHEETSPITCSLLAHEIPLSNSSRDKPAANDKKKIVNASTPVKEKHVDVQNYGSSSSSTPDIYDEFARKRRPKLLKPETIQIKPKPVTRPIPTTLCQPIVRKPPSAVITSKPEVQSHNTVGYCSYNSDKQKSQTMPANNAEDIKPCLKQTHRQTDGSSLNNLFQDSKTSQLKQSVQVTTDNTNSNTSCSYSSSLGGKKEMTRKIPSAKETRKPFVPEFCTFKDRPRTAKSSSTVNSNSTLIYAIDSNESVSTPNDVNSELNPLQNALNDLTKDVNKVNSTKSTPTAQRSSQSKCHLLEKVASFVNNYVSPTRSDSLEDINSIHAILSTNPLQCIEEINTDVNKSSRVKRNNSSRTKSYYKNLPHHKYVSNCEVNEIDQRLSIVDDQLYYKVPEEDQYHKVTGNMIIPPHAQFFIQSHGAHQVVANMGEVLENSTLDRNQIGSLEIKDDKLHQQNSTNVLFKGNTNSSMTKENNEDDDSIFDKILSTSDHFEDKADQMKHIIQETEQALLDVDKLLDEDETVARDKKVNEETISCIREPNVKDDSKEISPRIICPSPGLEISKKVVDKKKSFKEAVEEKRAQKRKTEKEISKKCFWGSAHNKSDKSIEHLAKPDPTKIKSSNKETKNNMNIKNVSKNTKPIKVKKSNTDMKIEPKLSNSSISKSEQNRQYGRQKDTNFNKRKNILVGQRPKSTDSKLKVAESSSKHCERFTGNVRTNIKASNNGVGKFQTNKTAVVTGTRKQRLSKSAHQFPRGRENNCIDDCTNKILTALRRLSIEKPKQNIDLSVSPKLVARQRKLRSCVVKNMVSNKRIGDDINDVSAPEIMKSGKDEQKIIMDEPGGIAEEYEASKQMDKQCEVDEERRLSNVPRDCYVSLRKLDDDEIALQQINTPRINSKELENTSCEEKTKCQLTTVPCDVNNEREDFNDRTFITNVNMNELSMKGNLDGQFEFDKMNLDKAHEKDFAADENINCADTTLHGNNDAPVALQSADSNIKPPVNSSVSITFSTNKLEDNIHSEIQENKMCITESIQSAIPEESEITCDKEETFLYMTEDDNVIDTEYHYVWIQNEHIDSELSTKQAELVYLDNSSYTNGGLNLNIGSYSMPSQPLYLQDDKHTNTVMDEQIKDYSYFGLSTHSNDPQSDVQVVYNDEEVNEVENEKNTFIDETDCGVEVYIDTSDVDRLNTNQTYCKDSDLIPDVNGNLDFNNSNEPEKLTEPDSIVDKTLTDEVQGEHSHTSSIKEDSEKSKTEIQNVKSVHHYLSTENILGDNLFNNCQVSPTQSEMDEYFTKVVERAGLNPFMNICRYEMTENDEESLEHLTEKVNCNKDNRKKESQSKNENEELSLKQKHKTKVHKAVKSKSKNNLKIEKSTASRVSEKNERNISLQKTDRDKEVSVSDNSESDISSLISSDVDDIDYNPDTDSNTDTDSGDNNDMVVARSDDHTKIKDKNKKTNHERASMKKYTKKRDKSPDTEIWRKYLKESYICDSKDGKVSSKKSNKQAGKDKLVTGKNSIVREYCLNHTGSEESLNKKYDKLQTDKFLSKKSRTSQENPHYDDSLTADNAQSTKKLEKRTKSKRKARTKKSVNTLDTSEIVDNDKETDDTKAAEGFIKTQQLYFNILKRSSVSGQDDKEDNDSSIRQVEDLPEVLEAVALHGERIISKAESEAEKSMEGTGSLDQLYLEDEGTIVEDLNNQCRYQMIEDEDHIQLGGIAYFKDFELPFVYINGYKYTTVKDALQIFQPRCCPTKCTIPRNVLHKYKPLVKSFSTWEQVYKLELIKMKKGPTVKTGDMLVKLDSFISLLPELIEVIRKQHDGTKLKNSQCCIVKKYKSLLTSIK